MRGLDEEGREFEALEPDDHCPLCRNRFGTRHPVRRLPCGHEFCMLCLYGLEMFARPKHLCCEVCHLEHPLGVGGVEDLPGACRDHGQPEDRCGACAAARLQEELRLDMERRRRERDERTLAIIHVVLRDIASRQAIPPLPPAEERRQRERLADELARMREREVRGGRQEEVGPREALEMLAELHRELLLAAAPAPRQGPLRSGWRFFFDLTVDEQPVGRVLIAVFAEAPRMARNFAALVEGVNGLRYRGCAAVQAWPRESLILGDVELNNGRGGRSAMGAHFAPDGPPLAGARGFVGMRRAPRAGRAPGLVGSQFRIVLRQPPAGYSAWFGRVESGLELLDRLSLLGDAGGRPRHSIVIAECGRLPDDPAQR